MKETPHLSFEDFDYDKARALLPEGYSPIPYVEFPVGGAQKLIKVAGYQSLEAAEKRLQELIKICPSDKYQIVPDEIQTTIKSFALIIPESAQKFLNENEPVAFDNPPIISSTQYSPIVYRFFNKKEYENRFFEKGELLISSFKRCKTKEVSDRQDKYENKNKFVIQDGSIKCETVLSFNTEALLLCTSLSQINWKDEGSADEFGFRINNTTAFFDILTRALVSKGISVSEVLRGPCIYSDKLITLDATGTGLIEEFIKKSEEKKLDFSPTIQFILEQAQNHILMNKPTVFAKENEYRHVWKLTKPIIKDDVSDDIIINPDGSIIINVPELIQFCERI